MNKVVTIHLDGFAYSLEEGAYHALQAYLDDAKQKLASNPDKDEIVGDLEQAIGAKLSAHLGAHKNVLTQTDVDAVLEEMGPVAAEGAASEKSDEGAASEEAKSGWGWPHKRLYRISEGRWIAGVCTGLAAYFNVDVTLVRILFVLCAIFFHGLGGVVYIIMMIVVPRARTPKDYENLSGIPPVTAQELVDRARKSVEDFANSSEWQAWKNNLKDMHDSHLSWKQQRKAWKRAQKRQWRNERQVYRQQHHSAVSEIFGIACAALAISFCLWFLYGHVTIFHQFFDAMHRAYESFIYSLAQLIDPGNR